MGQLTVYDSLQDLLHTILMRCSEDSGERLESGDTATVHWASGDVREALGVKDQMVVMLSHHREDRLLRCYVPTELVDGLRTTHPELPWHGCAPLPVIVRVETSWEALPMAQA